MTGSPSAHSRWRGQVALVTGASSGIGAAAAERLAGRGLRLALVARRADRLEQLAGRLRAAGGHALPVPADLTQPSGRAAALETVERELGSIDVLVNNAGFGWYGYTDEMSPAIARDMVELNAAAVVDLTLPVLGQMRRRGHGHIVNVSSIAGSLPSQGVAVYCATKAFLNAFSSALHRELRGSGVHVSVVKPGPVLSEFYRTAARKPGGGPVPAERFAVRAERVADRIWSLLNRPRRLAYVPGLLSVTPWIELMLGGIIDRLGPFLLRRRLAPAPVWVRPRRP